jgi:hypothetical protein
MRLAPYDDEHGLKEKLDGLRFRLDKRTGAIVADKAEAASSDRPQTWSTGDSNDTTSFLLGNTNSRT